MHFLVFLLPFLHSVSSYKIFVYSPQIARSHVSFMGHLADTLANHGHDVLVYLPELMPNVTATGVKKARTILKPRTFPITEDVDKFFGKMFKEDQTDPLELIQMRRQMGRYFALLCESQLSDKSMIAQLRAENFDLGIGEIFDPCSMAYMEAIGIEKYIAALSGSLNEEFTANFGVETNPSFVPAAYSPYADEMTYAQRLGNLLMMIVAKAIMRFVFEPPLMSVLQKQMPMGFDINEKIRKSSFLLVNSEDFTEFPRPITHKIVYVGGIGAKKPGPLSEEYQEVMDSATNGAVFISMGSLMKSSILPNATKEAFLGLFRRFPQMKFIWKYEIDDEVGNDIPNLLKVKWAPQNDLFGHPNMKAFISHGGLNSITECTHAGVPFIVIPVFGDQMRNAKMAERRGVAYVLYKNNLTEESLVAALGSLIHNDKYRNSAKRLQKIILGKPISPEERVVKYAEFAAEFGQIENIDSASMKLNFFQYYLLDILVPFAVIVLVFVYVSFRLSLYILRKTLTHIKLKKE